MNTILFLAANPIDSKPLRLDFEFRSIDDKLQLAKFRDMFDLRSQWAVRVNDLQGVLLRYKPTIVHFSGHGSQASELILEGVSGNTQPVSPQALRAVFSILRDNIRCIILNACYSELQAKAIAEHIECVIGMSRAISDPAAIAFASAFYQAIGYGRDVKTAFELGCGQIDLEGLPDLDTPKLLCMRGNPEQVTFVNNFQRPQTETNLSSLENVRAEVMELALKYARIRTEMLPGDSRTRKMEDVFTDMRILAFKSYPLLNDLANSTIIGERLAAIAILQAKPELLTQSEVGLDWIVKRIAEEKPFVGYHATKTLFAAAHYPKFFTLNRELQKAIDEGLAILGKGLQNSDRAKNLLHARQVLQK